jgi:hypothetical protein
MQRWLRSPDGMTPETIANMTAFLDAHATDAIDPANILTFGSSWGGLYAMLTGQTMPAGLRFHVNETDPDVVPWLELVRDGTFSTATLALLPTSYNVSHLLQFDSSVFLIILPCLLVIGIPSPFSSPFPSQGRSIRCGRRLSSAAVTRTATRGCTSCTSAWPLPRRATWSLVQPCPRHSP